MRLFPFLKGYQIILIYSFSFLTGARTGAPGLQAYCFFMDGIIPYGSVTREIKAGIQYYFPKMDCNELTQASVALAIMQTPDDKRLEKLFHCIYASFYVSFLHWIVNKYGSRSPSKDRLLEDAKDAFENGVLTLYEKAKKNGVHINGSLKTTVYSFGLLQFLALRKKDRSGDALCPDLLLDDAFSENERQVFLDDRENQLMKALNGLPRKQRQILMMRFFQKHTSKKIAQTLGVTPGYIDNASAKAYRKLRNILQSDDGFPS